MAVEYLTRALRTQRIVVDGVVEAIRKIEATGSKIDAIAWRGNSGAVVAPAVAYILDKPMMVVRKDTQDCHSTHWVEDALPEAPKSYVVIDDLVCSGKTVRAIDERVRQLYPDTRLLVVLCYDSDLTDTRTDVGEWSIPVLGVQALRELPPPQLERVLRQEMCYSSRRKARVLTPDEAAYKQWAEQDAALMKPGCVEMVKPSVAPDAVLSQSSLKAGDPVYYMSTMTGRWSGAESNIREVERKPNVQPLPRGPVTPWWKETTGYDVIPPANRQYLLTPGT